jgi:hypothetical protein
LHYLHKVANVKKNHSYAVSLILQGKAHQFSLSFNKTSFYTCPAQVKFKRLLFYTLHIILKGQHNEKYFNYSNELLAYHLGLFVQLNIYQLFFLSRCEIRSQLTEGSLHTGEENGDPSGSKSPHMLKNAWAVGAALLQVPPYPPLALF